jgi:hypothetical protein
MNTIDVGTDLKSRYRHIERLGTVERDAGKSCDEGWVLDFKFAKKISCGGYLSERLAVPDGYGFAESAPKGGTITYEPAG